ncbi:hypothetical protein IQ255_05915 [Pleurocapsales cyanobacterium LEGE 10410]|nr:hypothetical protein [Pleurocapsales cyanobacterium LEGE 10410]
MSSIVSSIDSQPKQTKVVYAPSASDSYLLTSIYSIEIDADRGVEWKWLELPDGNRVVTDYKIIHKQEMKRNHQ